MSAKRVRIVEGSCWACRKRRTKCDLVEPNCSRCFKLGTKCSYHARELKWGTLPASTVPTSYQVSTRHDQIASSLAVHQKRALEYFTRRFWPLLETTSKPCMAPTLIALEHRVVLLSACVIADTHRVLQDGRNSPRMLATKRAECLAAVRSELDEYCNAPTKTETLTSLLWAVLLLYFNDGFLEDYEQREETSTSHRDGLNAIIHRLGGIDTVMNKAPEPLHMLLSEFASSDLTTALLHGGKPSFGPEIWEKLSRRRVWWSRSPIGQYSLATVFEHMSRMAFYLDTVSRGMDELSMNRIQGFEAALTPANALLMKEPASQCRAGTLASTTDQNEHEVVDTYHLLQSFQYAALIYLYRGICGLPTASPQVQQNVLAFFDTLAMIQKPSKTLNCVTFTLLVAGSHVRSPKHRRATLKAISIIHGDVKFASLQAIHRHLDATWSSGAHSLSWFDMFDSLRHNIVVL